MPHHMSLQVTVVALSTTEAENIFLPSALCYVIPVMQLIEEIAKNGYLVLCTAPYISYKAFEDNPGAFELAHLPKLHPCTKHMNVHFHTAKILTKASLENLFWTLTQVLVARECCNIMQPCALLKNLHAIVQLFN